MRRAIFSLFVLCLFAANVPAAEPPAARRSETVDYYHGGAVADSYRWLEDIEADEVWDWVEGQNEHTLGYLDGLAELEPLYDRLDELYEAAPEEFYELSYEGGVLCARQYGTLVILRSVDDPTIVRTIVDSEGFAADHEAWIDFYSLSPDGRHLAVCISLDGLEDGTLYLYETGTGRRLDESIPLVSGPPGGDVAWKPDSSGFYYTRYPLAERDERMDARRYALQEIWFHTVGRPVGSDTYICGDELPRYPQSILQVSPDGRHLLVEAACGCGGTGQWLYVVGPTGKVRLLSRPEDRIAEGSVFGSGGNLLLHACDDSPRRRILELDPAAESVAEARLLVPQGEGVRYVWGVRTKHVYVSEYFEGSERLLVFGADGKHVQTIKPRDYSTFTEIVPLENEAVAYKVESFLAPPAWFRYDPRSREIERLPMTAECDVSFDDAEVVLEWATAGDGVKVPLTIIKKKNASLDGRRPTILYGYGGFAIIEQPYFSLDRRAWLDQGGVWAIAHPRGGGELGDDWYRQTLLGNKHITADDFIACAEHLIARKYTSPDRLGIMGGSFGGLLVGMAVTRRPELFAAAISDVGEFDIFRSAEMPFGRHLQYEYGSAVDREEFRRMKALSPYHVVKDDVQYPAIWLRTGDNDRRVMPWQSWKMAARLQAAGTNKPVLLYTVYGSGHDYGLSAAEDFAFLLDQMNVPYRRPRKKTRD